MNFNTKVRRTIIATALATAAIGATALLSGCGGSKGGDAPASSVATSTPTTTTSTPVAPKPSAKVTPNAAAIVQELKAKSGGHGKSVWVFTEDTDPNNLMGRPHGYTSATFLEDDRVVGHTDRSKSKKAGGGMDGVQVEQFATAADAKRRAEYISGIYDAAPMFGSEYLTIEGSTLLRVWGELKPSVNRQYVAAFKAALTK